MENLRLDSDGCAGAHPLQVLLSLVEPYLIYILEPVTQFLDE